MQKYKDLNKNSGILEFGIGDDYIKIKFKNSSKDYIYSYESAGVDHVEQMKKLAIQGKGLNSYIMRNVRDNYEK